MPSPERLAAGPSDLRMPLLGLAAWLGALAARFLPLPALVAVLVVGLALVLVRGVRGARVLTLTAALLVVSAASATTLVHEGRVAHNPVAALARDGAVADVRAVVTSDPHPVTGRYADLVALRVSAQEVTGRGHRFRLRAPLLVLADLSWRRVELGETVLLSGRLVPADDADVTALLRARGSPRVVAPPASWWRASAVVRSSLRASVAGRPPAQQALVPALVDGDDAGLPVAVADDFRTTGLTHLLAVSGTNLTLVVGFLLVLARWVGVRRYALLVVGAVGIAGFVLLARTEPSVLRAAVMGAVGLVAMASRQRERGSRALGVAVMVLVLVQPGLATAPGFALSVLATAGILVLAPGWRDALAAWLPRWLAEAIAVPAAAQIACTPLVAAISGQVSLVAVVANLLVAPVVGPATVLGLSGGLVGLVLPAFGRILGTLAGWCVGWIVAVAEHGAALPTASIAWRADVLSLLALVALAVGVAVVAPLVLRRPTTGLACGALLVVVLLVRPPHPGWPPDGWLFVACDVGQGDALVLHSGPGQAVVVDAGPDPTAVDRCLRRLDVREVPLVVLTHFHADHVDGLAGVLHRRRVGAIETTRLQDPPQGVAETTSEAAGAGLPVRVAPYAVTRTIGAVTLQVLWPRADSPSVGPGDGSTANESSVVLLVRVHGITLLLAGDVEPEGQAALARALPGLHVDVLKVPHHGSRYQDLDFLRSLDAGLAVVSVGAHNDYGHPAASVITALSAAGARVLRTDQDGDVAIAQRDGRVVAISSR